MLSVRQPTIHLCEVVAKFPLDTCQNHMSTKLHCIMYFLILNFISCVDAEIIFGKLFISRNELQYLYFLQSISNDPRYCLGLVKDFQSGKFEQSNII